MTLAMVAAPVAASAASGGTVYTPGAVGIGDPYVPNEGNGGYLVSHYSIDLKFNPTTDRINATTVVTAKATQNLSQMDFDLYGLNVTSVTVNGEAATTSRAPRELVVVPAHGINDGSTFVVKVDYQGKPQLLNDPNLGLSGWFNTDDGAIVAGEPEAGMFWFPANEHPSNKATFDVTATVPHGLTAVSNGLPTAHPKTHNGWTTFKWASSDPMSTYMATIAIGKFRVHRSHTSSGIPVLNYVDPSYPRTVDQSVDETANIINFYEKRFGPYPFDAAGGIADNYTSYYALENATRPTYDEATVSWGGLTRTVAHELAHQWFGDSVALHRWRDIWLNEGFATYLEWMWVAHEGTHTMGQLFNKAYAIPADHTFWTLPVENPGYAHMFDAPIYWRGAMTLYALRMKVGQGTVLKILRTWAHVHKDGNGTTPEFVKLAERVSGKKLDHLFHAWLVAPKKPADPRH
jgi:aminopeptidase N